MPGAYKSLLVLGEHAVEKMKVQAVEQPGGALPRPINTPADCSTIVVDGLTGATISNHIVRLHLVEHIGYEAETVAKHIVTLAFDVEQFAKFSDALGMIRDQIQAPKTEVA